LGEAKHAGRKEGNAQGQERNALQQGGQDCPLVVTAREEGEEGQFEDENEIGKKNQMTKRKLELPIKLK
jgi:hypothetical protein